MKPKAYISFGLAALVTVFLIAGVASGRIENDLGDINPLVLAAIAPGLVVMVVWHRLMMAAAVREIERMRMESVQRVLLSDDFLNHWTIRGALWGAVSLDAGLVGAVFLQNPPDDGGQVASAILGFLVVTVILALALGMNARRHILFQELFLTDERR